VGFSATRSTLEMYPIVVLAGGHTKWVACALGKEKLASAHCSNCRQKDRLSHWMRRALKVGFNSGNGKDLPRRYPTKCTKKTSGWPTWLEVSTKVFYSRSSLGISNSPIMN
jgi:hypothetical protein